MKWSVAFGQQDKLNNVYILRAPQVTVSSHRKQCDVWILCDIFFSSLSHITYAVENHFLLQCATRCWKLIRLPGQCMHSDKNNMKKRWNIWSRAMLHILWGFVRIGKEIYVRVVAVICAVGSIWFGRTFGTFQALDHSMHNKWNENNLSTREPQSRTESIYEKHVIKIIVIYFDSFLVWSLSFRWCFFSFFLFFLCPLRFHALE